MKYTDEKKKLIESGKYQYFKNCLKAQYKDPEYKKELGINLDPKYYDCTEIELDLNFKLKESEKRLKKELRKHARFMAQHYQHVGFITLTFTDEKIDKSNFETKRKIITRILKKCFNDYFGKFELSSKGRIHFHGIVCWNGVVATRKTNDFKYDLVINKDDLTLLWCGERNKVKGHKELLKYGVYDLILIDTTDIKNVNKTSNYAMKSLNTMESYIDKNENECSEAISSEELQELIKLVNFSNIIVKRNSDYHNWRKDDKKENILLRKQCRVFEPSYYQQHKYDSNDAFKQWAVINLNTPITEYLNMFPNDYELVDSRKYITELVSELE